MKLIIFEGLDRCGKDSYIHELTQGLRNYTIRHWSFPQGRTDAEKKEWQVSSFHNEFAQYIFLKNNFPDHTLFWNRAHLGELVYGTIYRESNPEEWVLALERHYSLDKDREAYLVHLTADPEFLVKHDDGKSYSNELEKKALEVEKFQQAVDQSKIYNKLTIKVNEQEQYRNFDSILQEIRGFVGF